MSILFLFAIAAGLLCGWFVMLYNKLIRMIEIVNNNKNQIDIQLDRRYKVYESLIEVVKNYMDYEKTVLKEVVTLRTQAQQARTSNNDNERIKAEESISKIGTNLNVIFEQYPELKADKNALQLQEEIVNTENRLAFSKQSYNDSVEYYVATRKSLFESLVVGMFPDKFLKEFAYWGVSDSDRQSHEAYTVKF